MVSRGAVNFHGYQRHSADVDFWIDMKPKNIERLLSVFRKMDYELEDLPEAVKEKRQNISIKFSSLYLDLELIINFMVNKSFQQDVQKICWICTNCNSAKAVSRKDSFPVGVLLSARIFSNRS